MRIAIGVVTLLWLTACGERDAPPGPSARPPAVASGAAAPASAATTGLALPARFTALGTEPFWAAKVDGDRLTYATPENQASQPTAATRIDRRKSVEIVATLGATHLILTVSAGPCNDRMSATVYPFAVRRQLGDDEQRGCARSDWRRYPTTTVPSGVACCTATKLSQATITSSPPEQKIAPDLLENSGLLAIPSGQLRFSHL